MPEPVSGKIFVDTNILFYAIDSDAGDKHERAREVVNAIWEDAGGVLNTQDGQVIEEVRVVNPLRET